MYYSYMTRKPFKCTTGHLKLRLQTFKQGLNPVFSLLALEILLTYFLYRWN